MDKSVLIFLACAILMTSAWSLPYYSLPRAPLRVTRFAPGPPPLWRPVRPVEEQRQRPKRDHDDYNHDHDDRDHDHRGTSGVTGPVHTFVKTDKNANYKWGVRHHVGNKYAS